MTHQTIGPQSDGPQRDPASESIECLECGRLFKKQGLGQHVKKAHPEIYNENITTDRIKKQWSPEEIRLVAYEEAKATVNGTANMNMHLSRLFPARTLEAIKGKRRSQEYKTQVIRILDEMKLEKSLSHKNTIKQTNIEKANRVRDNQGVREVIASIIKDLEKENSEIARMLIELGTLALDNEPMNEDKFVDVLHSMFPNVKTPKGYISKVKISRV